jgi:hypothetical protein
VAGERDEAIGKSIMDQPKSSGLDVPVEIQHGVEL